MKRLAARGFTLIELLTVIAIIMILASMVFVVGPRMIERAKISSWTSTCNEIRTTAAAYYTKKAVGVDTYPPAYGYLSGLPGGTVWRSYYLTPYMQRLKYLGNMAMYDPWAKASHDTDRDGIIGLLEFSPGIPDGPNSYRFPQEEVYNGRNLDEETAHQMTSQRPMLYIPVNMAQAKIVSEYYFSIIKNGFSSGNTAEILEGASARRWNPSETFANGDKNQLSQLRFPPSRYDDYALISVGPAGDTGGIVTPSLAQAGGFVDRTESFMATGNVPVEHWYHVLALRAYFLATRDINGKELSGNDMLDFDFRNRTRSREGSPGNYTDYSYNGVSLPGDLRLLPNGTNGAGPLIYMPNKAS